MLISSVTAKLRKAGWTWRESNNGQFSAMRPDNRYRIEWIRNGGTPDAICLKTRKVHDLDEMQSDYHAGCYSDSIKEAIARAERWEKMDRESDAAQAIGA